MCNSSIVYWWNPVHGGCTGGDMLAQEPVITLLLALCVLLENGRETVKQADLVYKEDCTNFVAVFLWLKYHISYKYEWKLR